MNFSSPRQFGQRLSSNSITPSIAARPGSSTDLLQTSRTSVPALGRALPVATGKYPAGHLGEGYVQTRSGQCDAACAKSLSVVSKVRSCLMHSCASRASIVPS